MDPDNNRLDMLRESIRLTEEILDRLGSAATECSTTEGDSVVVARLTRNLEGLLAGILAEDDQLFFGLTGAVDAAVGRVSIKLLTGALTVVTAAACQHGSSRREGEQCQAWSHGTS